MPQRIQRKRVKGWRMPEGCIYVGRPTIWGNPFWHEAKFQGIELSLALYRETVQGFWNPQLVANIPLRDEAYREYREFLSRIKIHPLEAMRSELRGHDLACFCPLDRPCHADILLELANK